MKEMIIKPDILNTVIRNRRSTFLRDLLPGGRIDDAVIVAILENACWAPTHGLSQTWFFKVYADNGVSTFFMAQQQIYKETTSVDKFNQQKFEKFLSKIEKVSHVIAVIVKRDPKKRFPKLEDIVSTSCALQNIYLSLEAYGIAGYLSTGDICYLPETRNYLGLEDDDECLGFFQLGIADPSVELRQRNRLPVEEKSEWIRS